MCESRNHSSSRHHRHSWALNTHIPHQQRPRHPPDYKLCRTKIKSCRSWALQKNSAALENQTTTSESHSQGQRTSLPCHPAQKALGPGLEIGTLSGIGRQTWTRTTLIQLRIKATSLFVWRGYLSLLFINLPSILQSPQHTCKLTPVGSPLELATTRGTTNIEANSLTNLEAGRGRGGKCFYFSF